MSLHSPANRRPAGAGRRVLDDPAVASRALSGPARRVAGRAAVAIAIVLAAGLGRPAVAGLPDIGLRELAAAERQPLLDTLKALVHIESGSRDRDGLDRLAALIAERFAGLGADVETIEPGSAASPEIYRMADTPERIGAMVKATLTGNGQARILMIAHMDTVYPRGMLSGEPFRLEGDRAYGLGIADDKQGIALILHSLALLQKQGFRDYGRITVLINGDEEISSPGSRALITRLAGQHHAVLSFEGAAIRNDRLSLATAGIGALHLRVEGKASHAGASPERGVNALYELSHQLLQLRDLSDPATGIKLNWTVAQAGTTRNVIPAEASASADVRVLKDADFARVVARVRERLPKQLLPEAKVTLAFERRRPPLEPNALSLRLARHAQAIYRELDLPLGADDQVSGGGTDAAFAGLGNRHTAVVERFGLQGFGAHSADAEYVLISSIEPRLYLVNRLVQDLSSGRLTLEATTSR